MKGDEAAKERGMKILAGCVVFGIILFLAPDIVSFLTGINIREIPQDVLPTGLAAILTKLLEAVQYGGAFLLVFGLIYGGYQYVKRTAHP
jgi:hypothetical protein